MKNFANLACICFTVKTLGLYFIWDKTEVLFDNFRLVCYVTQAYGISYALLSCSSFCSDRWLLESNRKKGFILFASDEDLRLASTCDLLMCDGTFKACPKGFYQLLTFHCKVL